LTDEPRKISSHPTNVNICTAGEFSSSELSSAASALERLSARKACDINKWRSFADFDVLAKPNLPVDIPDILVDVPYWRLYAS
jgi:hypothetical protein